MASDIGLVGLAVMGQNLALNLAGKGFRVSVFNRTWDRTEALLSRAGGLPVEGFRDLGEFCRSLSRPRKVMLMVKAGEAVDEALGRLLPFLDSGDVVIDGGNSFFKDTMRRERETAERGILYLGVGVSGGEEGALKGPSMMPGGRREAYASVERMFEAVAAKVGGEPCCAYIGPDGAGHYVKMVHNAIEYADMQLIAEAYFLMRRVAGMSNAEVADVFEGWAQGELSSYLVEITAEILRRKDEETGQDLVDVILDKAGQKGTGAWASQNALELGVPVPGVVEAVMARYLSALKEERVAASGRLAGPPEPMSGGETVRFVDAVKDALYASKICSYAQGFALMAEAGRVYGWPLDLGTIASIWRGGCIIRARFLDRIREAYRADGGLTNLMLDRYFREELERAQGGWRRICGLAVAAGVWAPAFLSSLAYYDGYRSAWLPANLLQAQRDYFGAHTYERTDRSGVFHTPWKEGCADVRGG